MRFVLLLALLMGCISPVEPTVLTKQLSERSEPAPEPVVVLTNQEPDILPSAVMRAQVQRRRNVGSFRSAAAAWALPTVESYDNTVLGLAKICVSEEGWADRVGCAVLWQIIRVVRARHCDRDRIPEITNCIDGEETYLSAMGRASKHVMQVADPRNHRQRWTSTLNLQLTKPTGWPRRLDWEGVFQDRWERSLQIARDLVDGRAHGRPVRAPIITWGKCGMDDHLALARGLVRVEFEGADNCLWRRPRPEERQAQASAELAATDIDAS